MKKGLTEIVLVLDRSGSMSITKSDAEGGLREFIDGQKKVAGECVVTLYRFDDIIDRVFDAKPIASIQADELRLEPRGWTALLDAMGQAIDEVGIRLSNTSDDQRPERVFFVTITDGMENRSRKLSRSQIFDKITQQRDIWKWEFVFIGANQDAIATAATLGIPQNSSITYAPTAQGTRASYQSVNCAVARSRQGSAMAFTDAERKESISGGQFQGSNSGSNN